VILRTALGTAAVMAGITLTTVAPSGHAGAIPPGQATSRADQRTRPPAFVGRPHRGTHRARTHVTRRTTPHVGLDPVLYREWTRVAVCEEGGWVGWSGPAFPDSLGITAANWWSHGGTADTSPAAQIRVAKRIQSRVPDQEGCAPW
jgi:hypothetical protein